MEARLGVTQAELWWGTGSAAMIAVGAGWAEWRRAKRRNLDQVGIVPWGAISVLGFLAAVVALALALAVKG